MMLTNEETKSSYLIDLIGRIFEKIERHEELGLNFSGEDSFFLRFNGGKVRQVTSLKQGILNFQFVDNLRSINYRLQISGQWDQDKVRVEEALKFCREKAKTLPQDPFFVPLENHGVTSQQFTGHLPNMENLTKDLFDPIGNLDFVGCLSMGKIEKSTFNSKGQAHRFFTENFQLDFSFYTENQKAVKGLYAGLDWKVGELSDSLIQSTNDLEKLKTPSINLPRGKYKVYLAPDAVSEIIDIFSWGAVSYSSLMRGNSGLKQLHNKEKYLSEQFSLIEDFSLGLNPRFNDRGEIAPETLPLIEKGKLKNLMVNARTAKEFGVHSNGASSFEGLRSTTMAKGNLKKDEILSTLGTGIYISNLHYLNWSDIQRGRFTGMTRFACFFVENGKIIAPIEDLRFDESLYDVFGENLLSITDFSQIIPNVGSYVTRSLGGKSVPGIMVKDFNFTL
jgi:predicted Zn-dependent protease